MVKFLLDEGADATELFGKYHRYYLLFFRSPPRLEAIVF